jgi:hypothetical protein
MQEDKMSREFHYVEEVKCLGNYDWKTCRKRIRRYVGIVRRVILQVKNRMEGVGLSLCLRIIIVKCGNVDWIHLAQKRTFVNIVK